MNTHNIFATTGLKPLDKFRFLLDEQGGSLIAPYVVTVIAVGALSVLNGASARAKDRADRARDDHARAALLHQVKSGQDWDKREAKDALRNRLFDTQQKISMLTRDYHCLESGSYTEQQKAQEKAVLGFQREHESTVWSFVTDFPKYGTDVTELRNKMTLGIGDVNQLDELSQVLYRLTQTTGKYDW